MEYTQNYHLPQWVKSDRIMMEDFNDAMSAMEDGMTATAQATARAEQSAKNAEDSAAAAAAARPYVVGRYTGAGKNTVNLGFRPSVVLISGTVESDNSNGFGIYFDMTDGKNFPNHVTFTDTGFTVTTSSNTTLRYPSLSLKDWTYIYIAFR